MTVEQAARYTICHDARAEARIAADLRRIASAIETELGPALAGILLVGGYARGEGSVVVRDGEAGPYNDYDLVALVRRPGGWVRRRLQRVAAEQTDRIGVDVDIWPVPVAELARMPRTLFWLDASRGGARLVRGELSLAEVLPRRDPRMVPLEEAGRLLANRAVGLALSNLETRDEDRRRARHVHKAVLACGDALLLAADRYGATTTARLEALEGLRDAPGVGPELVSAYREAVRFRERPDCWRAPGDETEWYEAQRARIARWHLAFEAWRVGSPEQPLALASHRAPLYPHAPDLSPAAKGPTALWAAARRETPLLPWVGHPRERLARAAVALAYGPDEMLCRVAAARLLGLRASQWADHVKLHAHLRALAARGG
ncbi:MAG: hypothetical protein ACOCUS_04875 [Polyangiales bacterium]